MHSQCSSNVLNSVQCTELLYFFYRKLLKFLLLFVDIGPSTQCVTDLSTANSLERMNQHGNWIKSNGIACPTFNCLYRMIFGDLLSNKSKLSTNWQMMQIEKEINDFIYVYFGDTFRPKFTVYIIVCYSLISIRLKKELLHNK